MASNPEVRDSKPDNAVRLIKKYPNRRLYDTKTSSYITLSSSRMICSRIARVRSSPLFASTTWKSS